MTILQLAIALAFLIFCAWLLNTRPVPAGIRMFLNIVIFVIVVVLVLVAFGVWGEVKSVQVPQLK